MEKYLNDVKFNYETIVSNIEKAASSVNKSIDDITFLAATKTVDVEVINFAISQGLKYIGENKVQELLSKYDNYDLDNASLQFIGHLQSNKIRQIIDKVDMIQSVDSLKLANEISRQAIKHDKTMDILVEINIGDEESKSGINKDYAYEFLDQIKDIPNIKVKGLMCIPPICENTQEIGKYFNNMHNLFIDIKGKNIDNIYMEVLSMGMSEDYTEAIKCGANMVRVGSALFGARDYSK